MLLRRALVLRGAPSVATRVMCSGPPQLPPATLKPVLPNTFRPPEPKRKPSKFARMPENVKIKKLEATYQIPLAEISAGPRDFRVLRSANGNLPIYTDIRNGGTRITTVLRKYAGDAEALAEELKSVTGKTVHLYHGRMEVKGRHRLLMTEWLEKLGF